MQHLLYVNTVYGMYLGVGLHNSYVNSVADAQLQTKIFKREFGAFGLPESNAQIFEERNFKPSFRAGEVIWISEGEDKGVFSTPDLAVYLVDWLVGYVAEQAGAS